MQLLVLPGDDIGPEIVAATVEVLQAVDALLSLGLTFSSVEVGLAAHRSGGTTSPEKAVQAARACDGIILGPCANAANPPRELGGVNVPGELRRLLDLYANIRPSRVRPGVPDARPGIDLVIARENTEGFYADRSMFAGIGEFMPTPDIALAVRKISAHSSRRIAEVGFRLAGSRQRKVVAVTKRSPLKLTDGLFMREVEACAAAHPGIEWEEMAVDAVAGLLYRSPQRFDVIVTTNMFGDILSNVAAEMSGGVGLAPSLNASDERAMANASHGSAPDIAGQDRANPTAMILSGSMLLEWLGRRHGRSDLQLAAQRIDAAVDAALSARETRTADLGGPLGTAAFGRVVASHVLRPAEAEHAA